MELCELVPLHLLGNIAVLSTECEPKFRREIMTSSLRREVEAAYSSKTSVDSHQDRAHHIRLCCEPQIKHGISLYYVLIVSFSLFAVLCSTLSLTQFLIYF